MSEPMLTELTHLHRSLGKLLDSPEPGLISWLTMLSRTLADLALWSGTAEGIAAAPMLGAGPELLSACRLAMACWYADQPNDNANTIMAKHAIRNAIAKATGQQS